MRLEDIATITVGQIMTRVSDKTGAGGPDAAKVLVPGAIAEGAIVDANLGTANLIKEVDDDKVTHVDDLIIKLSTPYDSAIVDKEHEGLIIPSFCAAIRPKEPGQYNLKFLCAYLNSSYVRGILAAMVQGSTRPMIRVSDIRAMELPDIDASRMEQLGEAYALSGQKKAILSEMIETEKRIMDELILQSVKGDIQ